MSIRKIEEKIIRKLISEAIKRGLRVSVDDGEGIALSRSQDLEAIMAELFHVDAEHLLFYREDGFYVGWVFLVHGNDGDDVICDYSATPEIEALVEAAE